MAVGMDEIRAAAERLFRGPQGARAFLEMRSPVLGGSPAELVEAGRGEEVLRFLEKLLREAPPPGPRIFGIPIRWGK